MARLINTNDIVLTGEEAKKVLKKVENTNISDAYKEKMDECVRFYHEIEEKSAK